MRAVAAGALLGALFGVLVLGASVAVAAWTAIAVAVIAIGAGAVDYVRTHG